MTVNGRPETNVETMCEESPGSVAASVTSQVFPGSSGSENGTRTPAWADKAEKASAAIAGRERGRGCLMGSAYPNAGRPVK